MTKEVDTRRKFSLEYDDGVVKTLFVGIPSADSVRAADWEHAKAYNRALKEGVFTVSEMMDILKERNIIGPDYDMMGEDLRTKLTTKVVEMETESDADKRMLLALEVATLREEVFQWNQRLSGPLANTCENIANDIRVEFLTSTMIQVEDGSRLWESFDAYRNEKDVSLQMKARLEVMLWLEGVESDFLENAPENIVLRGLADSAEEKKEDELPVEEEVKKPKKRTRKATSTKRKSKKSVE